MRKLTKVGKMFRVTHSAIRILLALIMFQRIRVIMNKLSSVIILKHLNGMQTEGGHPPSYQFGVSLSLVTTDKPGGKGAGRRQNSRDGDEHHHCGLEGDQRMVQGQWALHAQVVGHDVSVCFYTHSFYDQCFTD